MILQWFRVMSLIVLIPFILMGCENAPSTELGGTKSAAELSESAEKVPSQGEGFFEIGIIPRSPTAQDNLRAVVSGNGIFSYAWFVNDEPVPEEPGMTLSNSYVHKGDIVTLEVTSGGETQQSQIVIGNTPPAMKEVSIKNDYVYHGVDLQVEAVGEDPDNDSLEFLYTWFINDDEQSFDHDAVLPGERFYKGDKVQLYVKATDGEEESQPFLGVDLLIPNAPPHIISKPSGDFSQAAYEYQVVAEDPDQDTLNFSLETAPVGMTIDSATGLIQWPLERVEMGSHSVKIKVTDPDGGEDVQEFDLQLAPSQ